MIEKIRKNHKKIRWILLVPASFIFTGAIFFLVFLASVSIVGTSNDTYINICAAICAAITAIAFVYIPYFIAPDYKKIVATVFWVVGSIFITIIYFELYTKSEKQLLNFIIKGSIIPSFVLLLGLIFYKAETNKIDTLLDEFN